MRAWLCAGVLACAHPALASPSALPPYADPPLETRFADPPAAARPRIVLTGSDPAQVPADLAWIKRMGFGGVLVDGPTTAPVIAALATEADRLGLELVIAPTIERAIAGDGLKKVVWTQAAITPGAAISAALPVAGVGDIAVFAFPQPTDGSGVALVNVINLTDKVRGDGSLDWAPADPGDTRVWQLLRLGYVELAAGATVDAFDGASVRRAVDSRIAAYRAATGGLVGQRGVQALLIRPPTLDAANWTPRMAFQFKRLRGYDAVPWLPVLAGVTIASRAESNRFLADYRTTLAELAADEFSGMIAHAAIQNDLRIYGTGDSDAHRHADVPMVAEAATGVRTDGKAAASIAHLYGQNLAAAAIAPGGAGGPATPADVERDIDRAWGDGINRPLLSAAFNRRETWAEMVRPIADSFARQALLLQSGTNVADVVYALGDGRPPVVPPGYAYDTIGAHALTTALINDGNDLVSPGGARYRLLVLGPGARQMSLALLKRLGELVAGGATVLGDPPALPPSLADDDAGQYAALVARLWPGSGDARVGMGRVIAGSDVARALLRLGLPPQVRFDDPGASIALVQRHRRDGESFFLLNRSDRETTFEAGFRIIGKAPELWHPESGRTEPLPYRSEPGAIFVPLTLAPGEAANIVFDKPAVAPALAIKKLAAVPLASVTGPWRVSFEPGHGGPTQPVAMPTLVSLDQSPDPRLRQFSGVATYARTLVTPRGWKHGQPLWLDLGNVREVAEVWLNGKNAGTAWRAPFRIDIGALAEKGNNKLEVRVANLWTNHRIAEGTLPAGTPLAPSGLIGPVILLGQGR